LPNTKGIIRERRAALETEPPSFSPDFHFAVKQQGVNLDFYLEHFYRHQKVSLHYFTDFDSLITVCQRYPISAITIGGTGDFLAEIEMVRAIKANAFLSIIPVITFHPEPSTNVVIAAYESGVEDFVHGEWMDRVVELRIRSVIERNRRDLSINPSTLLPGPGPIEREIQRQINMAAEFAVCYADLDNFKAYNDYYGYTEGDGVIRLTGKIIKDVVFDACREGFVGHIAGDDFIFIIPRDLVDNICSWIIKSFDALVPFRYRPEDRRRGFITTVSRRETIENYPLLTISIAVVINRNGTFSHPGELSRMLADLKKAAKKTDGSCYLVERRKKY
jgi:GGDEF domain-containing protein